MYTQTKKLRPIFMVLYLSIQLRYRNKNKTEMFFKRRTQKNGNYLILSSYHEGLLNLMCTQLFSLSSGKLSPKRDKFYVNWQPETSDDEKTSKNSNSAY